MYSDNINYPVHYDMNMANIVLLSAVQMKFWNSRPFSALGYSILYACVGVSTCNTRASLIVWAKLASGYFSLRTESNTVGGTALLFELVNLQGLAPSLAPLAPS